MRAMQVGCTLGFQNSYMALTHNRPILVNPGKKKTIIHGIYIYQSNIYSICAIELKIIDCRLVPCFLKTHQKTQLSLQHFVRTSPYLKQI